jgi:Tfp pilus assembly protein PilO
MKPKQLYFIILSLLALVVAGLGAGLYLANGILVAKTTKLTDTLAQTTVASDHADDLAALKSQYQALTPKFAQLELSLPRDKKQSEILLQIKKLADENGVTIDSTNFTGTSGSTLPGLTSQTVPAGDAIALPISFSAKASYANFLAFLKRLELLNRYSNVTAISVTSTVGGDGKPSAGYSVSLNAYIKP